MTLPDAEAEVALMPDLTDPSDILTEEHRRMVSLGSQCVPSLLLSSAHFSPPFLLLSLSSRQLYQHLPARAEGYTWSLIYSTAKHGFSLKTMYREMAKVDTPILMVIQDTSGAVFGALTSHPLRTSDLFYGTGESFLFTFYPDFEKFGWTGHNQYFIKGNSDSLVIGAGR